MTFVVKTMLILYCKGLLDPFIIVQMKNHRQSTHHKKHRSRERQRSDSRNRIRSRDRSRRRRGDSRNRDYSDDSRTYRRHRDRYSRRQKRRDRSFSRDRSRDRRRRHRRSRDRSYASIRSSHSQKSSVSSRSSSSSQEHPHFKFRTGELLGKKYRIRSLLGDGTFGRVVEAEFENRIYAIKIIKAVSRYIESAKTEKSIIRFINSKDPEDKQGIVRYMDSFHHYSHYCIVFKPLGKSLYDVLKMNKYKGFPMRLVQSFFKQILRSIGFMHKIGYTHTDLKPQNVLLEQNRFKKHEYQGRTVEEILLPENDRVRIIDFGGATEQKQHHSKIVNTRQYRSPEVIMGCCQWDHLSDVWSIGCIIVELYTGQLYFETHENVEHLRMIEKHGGPYPEWMINRSSEFRDCFENGKMLWPRGASSSSVQRVQHMKTLGDIFAGQAEVRDLLEKCLEVDPRKRISCAEALKHHFFELSY